MQQETTTTSPSAKMEGSVPHLVVSLGALVGGQHDEVGISVLLVEHGSCVEVVPSL